MNKRGQAEQFNWIFVIVAGAIILGFFVMFIFKFVELQEKKQDVQTVRFFSEGVLSAGSKLHVGSGGAAVDSQGEDGIRFGYNTRLGYLCNDNEATILINDGETAWYKLEDEIVFMDKSIDFSALDGVDLWILPWNYPFHVTNFVYLANSDKKFYLVYDSIGRESVNQLDLSSVFNTEILPESELNDIESNSKVVFFTARGPDISRLRPLLDKKSDFVHVNGNKVMFFDGEEWGEAVEFYGLEQLYGAILSNDADNFECNINRALDRVKVVANIYSERTRFLSQIDRREGCNYAGMVSLLNQYASGNLDLKEVLEESNIGIGGGCLWAY